MFSDSAVKTNSKSAPFLLDLVLNDAGQEIATPDAAASFADKILPTAKTRTIQTENGDKPVRFVTFAMVANFEDKRAQKYLQHVRKYAKQYNVSTQPGVWRHKKRKQLQPACGQRSSCLRADATGSPQWWAWSIPSRKKPGCRSPHKLFARSGKQHRAGAAYLSALTFDQLDKVSDRTSRDYCVISAYNTGPSNVMRAFTDAKGKQRFDEGFQRTNNLSPAQVFQTLHEKLPYEETRGYLPTGNTNRKRYYSIDKTVASGDNNALPTP